MTTAQVEPWQVEVETATDALLRHFEVASLDGFGLGGKPQAVRAAAALLGLLAGVWADRMRRKPILAWTDIRRGVLLTPNPHGGDISTPLPNRLLRQADIDRDDWRKL